MAGHGRQVTKDVHRGKEIIPDLIPKARLEIAVNDEFVETTVNTIIESARESTVGDGKIFITPLEECIRIRTGERGSEAM